MYLPPILTVFDCTGFRLTAFGPIVYPSYVPPSYVPFPPTVDSLCGAFHVHPFIIFGPLWSGEIIDSVK